jgi:hypothetical protein
MMLAAALAVFLRSDRDSFRMPLLYEMRAQLPAGSETALELVSNNSIGRRKSACGQHDVIELREGSQ